MFDFNYILLPLTLLIFLIVLYLAVFVFFVIARRLKNTVRSLKTALFLITLPIQTKKENEPTMQLQQKKEIIAVMEQFYSSLAGFKKTQFIFELALPHIGEEIAFYLSSPQKIEEAMQKSVHGFYPTAHIEKVKDYNIFNPKGVSSGGYFKLRKSHILPLKTYQNLESDPLENIANALSRLEKEGEGAALQIVIKPIGANWKNLGLRVARKMQEGRGFEGARKSEGFFGQVIEILKAGKKKKTREGETLNPEQKKPITPLQEEIIKAIEGKTSKTGFLANIRILVSGATQERTEQILNQITASFSQFNAPNLNGLVFRSVFSQGLKKLIYQYSFRLFNKKQAIILNTEELTGIFHFPSLTLGAPKIKTLKAKQAAVPPNLPPEGLILGKNVYRGEEAVVKITPDDRRRHLYIIGQTGTGKSGFLQNMAAQDIKDKQGLAVLDPHGDLIEKVLSLIPEERAEDLVLLDPSDLERPLGLNMLEYDPARPEQKTFIVNELINIFDKLYDLKQTGGPMFEQYTRNALLLLMDDPGEGATLMEVPKVLSDAEFRKRLLNKCKNIVVKDFWEKEAEKAGGEAALANITPYVTSKFNVFIANDFMRPIIGQSKSTLNFREIMDNGKILLVNLTKGRLGEINSSLLGLIIVGKLMLASFSRIDLPDESRRDFYLYIDEFQNFVTESVSTILSEARKYRLNLIIAHQFIGQLPEKIRDAVFGNVGSLVSFRLGAPDAEFLVKQFEPVFSQNDLINIDNFNAYVKLLIHGLTVPPFNIQTYPPQKGSDELTEALRELSRLKYGRPKDLVEQEILGRFQLNVPSNVEISP